MTKTMIVTLTGALFVAGLALLYLGDEDPAHGPVLRAVATALMVVPSSFASSELTRRRRRATHQDDPASLEFQANRMACTGAYRDGLILAAGMVLALAMRPGPTPALWGLGFLCLTVVDYWVRYYLTLGRLGG